MGSGQSEGRPGWSVWLLLALLAFVAWTPAPALAAQPDPKPTCQGSLQTKIGAAPAGGTVRLDDGCVYRESVEVDRPLTLVGGEIRGSDVWEGWRESGPVWVSERSVPGFPAPVRSICEGPDQRCLWHEQAFVDGEPLEQVASDPGPGQFSLDARRRIVLAEDPAGNTVEVTTRPTWVVGASDDVTVRDVTMKHAAESGLWNGGHSGWTVEGSDLSHAHEKNLALTLGSGLVARDNDLHDAGQLGLASNEADIEIVGNRVHGNNTEGFSTVWEAGGMKIAQPRTVRISGNEVYHNADIGIWIDVVNDDQRSVEITANRVHHQPWQGIRVEISKNFEVRENVVWENGWGKGDSYNGVGISISGSRDGVVEDNVLAWNASGIGIVQQDRDRPQEQSYDTTRGVTLGGNKVVQDEVPGTVNHAAVYWNEDANAVANGALALTDPAAGNGGSNNAYWFDEPEGDTPRFKLDSQLYTLDEYNATPAEDEARYLTAGEKKALLKDHDLPARPGDHPSQPSGTSGLVAGIFGWLRSLLA